MLRTEVPRARLELVAILARARRREVAARCRVSASRVSKWVSGDTKPNAFARSVLESCYGIAASGWDAPKRRVR